MKIVHYCLLALIFIQCSKGKEEPSKFILPSIGCTETRDLEDFNLLYELTFYDYEGLGYKVLNSKNCYIISPHTLSSKKYYMYDGYEKDLVLQKIGDEKIEHFEIIYCNSISIEELKSFLYEQFSIDGVEISATTEEISVQLNGELICKSFVGSLNGLINRSIVYKIKESKCSDRVTQEQMNQALLESIGN